MTTFNAAELGAPSWVDAGLRRYGGLYETVLQFAETALDDASVGAVDPVTLEYKAADPRGSLQRIVYQILQWAEAMAPELGERPELPETTRKGKTPREGLLVDILHDFIISTDEARRSGTTDARSTPGEGRSYSYSTTVLARAVERIEAAG